MPLKKCIILDVLTYILSCNSPQELEENLRDAQSTAQRMETQLVQKERLYEDKIKVGKPHNVQVTGNCVSENVERQVNVECQKCSNTFSVLPL